MGKKGWVIWQRKEAVLEPPLQRGEGQCPGGDDCFYQGTLYGSCGWVGADGCDGS